MNGVTNTNTAVDYVTPEYVMYGKTVTARTTPVATQHMFAYWTDSNNHYMPGDEAVITGDTTIKAIWTTKTFGGGVTHGTNTTKKVNVSFQTNGGGYISDETIDYNANATKPVVPEKEGYTFEGWFVDEACTIPFDFSSNLTSNTKVYAGWAKDVIDEDESGVSKLLETGDHIKYLVGYETGDFRPEGNMTRAEVAQMFYNLLLNKYVPGNAHYTDVEENKWYTDAIITLSNLGMLAGIGDEKYAPNSPVTRAEFVAIATRFANVKPEGKLTFKDVPEGHWAAESISDAALFGWVNGDENGNFNPDSYIQRCQVAKIVNFMLGRKADLEFAESHRDRFIFFPDVSKNAWYYDEVVESTNAHEYDKNKGVETWK